MSTRKTRALGLGLCSLLAAVGAEPFVASAASDAASGSRPSLALGSAAERAEGDAPVPALRLRADGSFRALLLADIQIGKAPFRDAEALRMIDRLVAKTDPDLILTLGDNSCSFFSPLAARRLVSRIEGYGRPWAVVLGNHDAEGPRDRAWFGRLYQSGRGSLFRVGPSSIQGTGNYHIELEDGDGNDVFSFIMLDSNEYRRGPDGKRGYDHIHPDQIAWYEALVRSLATARFGDFDPAAGKVIPSMLLFHIPLPQVTLAVEAMKAGQLPAGSFSGVAGEAPCPAIDDSGLFAMVKKLGSTGEIVVGHDHLNDASILWDGVRLTYGRKTGPASYHDDRLLGATLVRVAPSGGLWAATSEAVPMMRR